MRGRCPRYPPASEIGDHSCVAYLEVDDIQACYARAEDAGAEVSKELRREPWEGKSSASARRTGTASWWPNETRSHRSSPAAGGRCPLPAGSRAIFEPLRPGDRGAPPGEPIADSRAELSSCQGNLATAFRGANAPYGSSRGRRIASSITAWSASSLVWRSA